MFPRWWRLGIRPQLTIIVILGAILSTFATLFIADNAIQNYVVDQGRIQEQENMKIARLVLETQYGPNISISHDGQMVVDLPGGSKDVPLNLNNNFGRYVLNKDTDFVDKVQQLIGGNVSVFQCANAAGGVTGCIRIASTFKNGQQTAGQTDRALGQQLSSDVARGMHINTGNPESWIGVDTSDGASYLAEYAPIFNPQQQLIGVIYVGVPLDTITAVVQRTTVELVLIGTIIMIAGIIFALFFANAIISTLQRAARQISGASERIGSIASQQSSGASQQVWAINAINQALQNFSETAKDISHRTDQLALMGNQVLQRRQEISPTQIDSILAYITRSVRDISVASKQQAVQYERMTGAMQAVIEIAEQVADHSQASSESSERLELVVRQLRQLVGVRGAGRRATTEESNVDLATQMGVTAAGGAPISQSQMRGGRGASPLRRGAGSVSRAPNTDGMGVMAGSAGGYGMMAPPSGGMGSGGGYGVAPQSAGGMGSVGGAAGGYGMAAPPSGGMGMIPAGGYAPRGGGGMSGVGAQNGYGQPASGRGMVPPPPPGAMPDWRLPPLPEMPPPDGWGGADHARPSRDRYAPPSGNRFDGDGWPRSRGE